MLASTEILSVGEAMGAEGATSEVVMEAEGAVPEVDIIKVPTKVPKSPRTPRSRPTPT